MTKGRLKVPASFRAVIEPKYGNEFFVTSLRGDSVRDLPDAGLRGAGGAPDGSSSVGPLVSKLRTH